MENNITNNITTNYKQYIESVFTDEEYTFEAFVLLKDQKTLCKFTLYEGNPEDRNDSTVNFKKKIQFILAEAVKFKYAGDTVEYDSFENIADNQNKFYSIPQTNEYNPFSMLKKANEAKKPYKILSDSAEGIFFRFEREDKTIWIFQYFWPNTAPATNRMKRFHVIPYEGDVYRELEKPFVVITQKIDFIIINDCIVTDDLKFLQSHYNFEKYVRDSAKSVCSQIVNLKIVSNENKLQEYISHGKLTYSKKMLRIKNSKVFNISNEELFTRITTLPRWKGKFEIDETSKTIKLKTNKQVENLIDLLDERYTRSDVTNEEYDTTAKKWVAPL